MIEINAFDFYLIMGAMLYVGAFLGFHMGVRDDSDNVGDSRR